MRQLQNHKNADLDELLANRGQVRSTPADKAAMIVALREMLKHPPATPDLELGRAVVREDLSAVATRCTAQAPRLAPISPVRTGPTSNTYCQHRRPELGDLERLPADGPSDGRRPGHLRPRPLAEDDKSVTIQTTTEAIVVPKDEIESVS